MNSTDSAKTSVISLPVGIELNNRYIIKRVLSSGGFSITYIAYDKTLSMDTIIKEYMPKQMLDREDGTTEMIIKYAELEHSFKEGSDNFLSEARILARFSECEGIVSVMDYFAENNTAYIVMPYIQGITLSEYISKHGKLSKKQCINMLAPIISTLSKVHKEGIIHRDISPDNILITDDGKAILLDFGICMPIERKSGTIVQEKPTSIKRGYAPPEQYCYNGIQGPWTDVYSLAATMYFCIHGKSLKPSVERMHKTDEKLNISPAIQKALSLLSKDRYPDMISFYQELNSKNPKINIRNVLTPVIAACFLISAFFLGYILKGKTLPADVITVHSFYTAENTENISKETTIDSTPNPTTAKTPAKEYTLLELSDNEPIPITDSNLESAIREQINKPTGDITKIDISEVRSLTMTAKGIKDLDGIQYFENLTWLDITSNMVEDLTPITYLKHLDMMNAQGNIIYDISVLESCISISQLDLSSNYIVDITVLQSLENLTWLGLVNNRIKDVTPIMHLPKLQWLNLAGNDIDDYSCLAQLPRIEELTVNDNNSTNTEAFKDHPTLIKFQP